MVVIWDILKKTFRFTWEEIIYLVVFNMVTLAALLAGPTLVVTGLENGQIALMLLGSVAIFAIPPALFGLFWLTYQVSLENAVKFSTFVDGAKQFPKLMWIWGGINLLIVALFVSNIIFYLALETVWAAFVGQFFYGLFILWIILQLLTLAMIPHLETPTFRLALQNALRLFAINPFAVVGMAIFALAVFALGGRFAVILGLIAVSLTALVTSVTVQELVKISRGENKN